MPDLDFFTLQTYNTLVQNKQALIGIAAAVLILLGAGGVFLYSQNKSGEPNSITATENSNDDSFVESDLTTILKSGKTQQCSFSYDDLNGSITTGTAYMSGDKMRTDINSSANGDSSTINVIRNGDDNFIWGSAFPNNTGMKMTMSIDDYATNEDSKKYFDPNMKADYECSGWTVDTTVFTPPSTIKFQDISAMMEGLIQTVSGSPTGAAGSSASQCGICNSLTGDAKNACLQQLSC